MLCGDGAVSYTHLDVYKRQPVIASDSFSNIPRDFAIAVAVILWSPVIITAVSYTHQIIF